MRSAQTLLSQLLSALFLVGLGAAWVLLCPRQFGGQASYVIVHGTSMLPRFHEGDLVILRQAEDYQVGEIVTYQYPGIGPVIHRIVGKDQQHYQIKGDNNSWVDAYEPVKKEIFGAYWFSIPGIGRWIATFRSPWLFGLLAGLGTLLIGLSVEMDLEKKQTQHFGAVKARAGGWLSHRQEKIAGVIVPIGLACGLLLAFSLWQPPTRLVPLEISLQQTAHYEYGATLPPDIYDNDHLTSGGAIFPQAGCTVQLLLGYHLSPDRAQQVSGTHHLTARIEDGMGWQRSIALEAETAFEGAGFQTSGKIDFCAAQALIDDLQQATGARSMDYQLIVSPDIHVHGTLDGYAFQEQYNPTLVFNLNPYEVTLVKAEHENPLETSQTSVVKAQAQSANTLSLWLVSLPVMTARWLGLVGLLLCGGLLAALYWLLPQRPAGVREQMAHLTGRPLVEVLPGSLPALQVVWVRKMEDLAAVSGDRETLVLYTLEEGRYTFLVQTEQALYAYAAQEDQPL